MKKQAILWDKLESGLVQCRLCAHNCGIKKGHYGFCGVRENINGVLYTHAYGEVIASNVDPIEKKPLYHLIPGSKAFSVATIGCNFKCSFCQNWNISQRSYENDAIKGTTMSPEDIVFGAIDNGCESISYTYTEPTIYFEYALETSRIAKEKGLKNTFVTNGFMSKEAIKEISPYLDAANIDLKFFTDDAYKNICKGRLQPVLDSIRNMKEEGIWVEVTTLIVPGENDSDEELSDIAGFISEVDKNIPWHVSRFHPDYQYTNAQPTPVETIERALEIGKNNGHKYIYPGNVISGCETYCPECDEILIRREGFSARFTDNWNNGKCIKCGEIIPGVWE